MRGTKHALLLAVALLAALFPAPRLVPAVLGQTRAQQRTDHRTQIRTVQVPDLTRHSVDDARTILARAGLGLGRINQAETSQAPPGTVMRQHPAPLATVRVGTAVNVWVAASRKPPAGEAPKQPTSPSSTGDAGVAVLGGSTGTALATVPKLVSNSLGNAPQVLNSSQLRLGSVKQAETSQAPPGTIIRQEPQPGTRVPVGTAVNVWVAAQAATTVPNLVGQKQGSAEAMLGQANLRLGNVQEEKSEKEPGTVLRHEPPADASVPPGSSVSVWVARETPVRVVLGVSPSDARRGKPVRFTATLEPASTQAEYQFVFGDHEETTWTRETVAEHVYKQRGTYRAQVIVRVGRGPLVESKAAAVKVSWSIALTLLLVGVGALPLLGGAGGYWYVRRLLRLVRIAARADAAGSQQIEVPPPGKWFAEMCLRVVRSPGEQTIEWEVPLARRKGVGHE